MREDRPILFGRYLATAAAAVAPRYRLALFEGPKEPVLFWGRSEGSPRTSGTVGGSREPESLAQSSVQLRPTRDIFRNIGATPAQDWSAILRARILGT